MAAVRHLGFVVCMFGPPTTSIWWYLSMCKIWLESMQYSFDNMQVMIFNVFGLKMPIHTRSRSFFLGGGFNPPPMGSSHIATTQKAPPCAKVCHTMYRLLRLVHPFLLISVFYPISQNPMFCNWLDTPLKVPLGASAPPTDRQTDRQCYLWQ